MGTTTVRVDSATHAQLVQLSRASGKSIVETVREATEALLRLRFANRVAEELDDLRNDSRAWHAYLADADSTATDDGVR